MAREILPRLNHCRGMNASQKDTFRRDVKSFSTFAWQKYQELYPDINLPSSILTIGPDFIATGIRKKLPGTENAEPVTDGIDFSRAFVTSKFSIGELPPGSSLNGYFDYLFEHGELQPAYTLFIADDSEWDRVKGNQKADSKQDDFVVHKYLVGNEVIEVWAFDVLNPVVRQPLNTSGSTSLTTAKNEHDW